MLTEYNYNIDPVVANTDQIEHVCSCLKKIGDDLKISISLSTKYPSADKNQPTVEYFMKDNKFEGTLDIYLEKISSKRIVWNMQLSNVR